jgi:hypothetical protein
MTSEEMLDECNRLVKKIYNNMKNSAVIKRETAEKLLEHIQNEIRYCYDDPNYKGKPPERLLQFETELEFSLKEKENE